MTKQEFALVAKALKVTYNQERFMADSDALEVWYEMLKDLDYKSVSAAVKKHIMTSKWTPTIADIRELATKELDTMPTEQEAWAMVRKACNNAIYEAEKEFSQLPFDIRKAVGDPETLRRWALVDASEFETVLQSNFCRSYRVMEQRRRTEVKLPTELKTLIEDTLAKMPRLEEAKAPEPKPSQVPREKIDKLLRELASLQK